MKTFLINRGLAVFLMSAALLSGCATSNGGGGSIGSTTVGPKLEATPVATESSDHTIAKPFMVVPVFDPNIPEDKAKIEELAIWPEVRRTEAVRSSVTLSKKLAQTGVFNGVRTTPDTETSAHLYTLGKILKSNGQEFDLSIEVVSISGASVLKKKYSFTVDEYELDNPRNAKNSDLYEEFFSEIAEDIAAKIEKMNQADREELARVEELRYADFFEPNFSRQFTSQNWRGATEITSYPNPDDPMMRRIASLKVGI